jgi:hypothetical protein
VTSELNKPSLRLHAQIDSEIMEAKKHRSVVLALIRCRNAVLSLASY